MIEWYKKRAKQIKKDMHTGNDALARSIGVRAPFDATLMVVQHCLAKSAGFNSWHDLLHASAEKQQEGIDRLHTLGVK